MFPTLKSREGRSKITVPVWASFKTSSSAFHLNMWNSDAPRTVCDPVSEGSSMQRKTLHQPDIIKTNTSVYLYRSKNTKRDLIDNNQPDFFKFTFPHSLLLFLSHTHSIASLKLLSSQPPCSTSPNKSCRYWIWLFSVSPLLCFCYFFPLSSECISSSPLLQFCLYPVSQICITKVYHIRLAYGKGGILFWKVKGIREKKNPSGQK